MPRPVNNDRKPELLDAIIAFMLDKPMADLTFRGLAEHLSVSTFTLVYHFGTKQQLIADIVESINALRRAAFAEAIGGSVTLDEFFDAARKFWLGMATTGPARAHRLAVQRLAFEAGLSEAVRGDPAGTARGLVMSLRRSIERGLLSAGLDPATAKREARMLAMIFNGVRLDLVLTGDEATADDDFVYALDSMRERTRGLLAGPASA